MRNPVTKLTVAAAIVVVAGITGLVMWTHTGSGIALAARELGSEINNNVR